MPDFSVIVPTCDRPGPLARCLTALGAQTYSAERFEIIVVDDGGRISFGDRATSHFDDFDDSDDSDEFDNSDDFADPDDPHDPHGSDHPDGPYNAELKSLDEAITACRERGIDVKLLRQANAGPAAARNAGARIARGSVLAFTDDDCLPGSDWLLHLDRRHRDAPVRMLGGRTVNVLRDNVYSMTSQLIVELVYDHVNADPEQAVFFSSNNLAVPRAPFLRMGGFNETLRISEDRELCDRWRHSGHKMTYVPEAEIHHAHPMTLRNFVRRHFGRGRGAFAYHRIRSARASSRLRDDFSFHRDVRNLLVYPFAKVSPREAIPLSALLLTWQVANTAGFAWEAVRTLFLGSDGVSPRPSKSL